jgi:hypothetical protein
MDHPDVTKEQAVSFFAELFGGEHHIPNGLKPYGSGWKVSCYGDLSTFDFDRLTRLVFLAHDRCVRAVVEQSGPRMVGIVIWQRAKREGSICERHPTIEQALEMWRKFHPKEDEFKDEE